MQTPYKSLFIEVLVPCDEPVTILSFDGYLAQDVEWHQYPLRQGEAGFCSMGFSDSIFFYHSRLRLESNPQGGRTEKYSQAHEVFNEPVLKVHGVLNGRAIRHDFINGHDYVLDENRVYLNTASHSHFLVSVDTGITTDSVHMGISQSAMSALIGAELTQALFEVIISSPDKTHHLGQSVMQNFRCDLDVSIPFSLRKMQAHGRCLEFISLLVQHFLDGRMDLETSCAQRQGTLTPALSEIRDYVRRRAKDRLTLKELAEVFGVSDKTISNHLMKQTGMPAAQFMREQRLLMAHEMIEQSTQSLGEIGRRCGYPHMSNFSAAFRKMFDYSPTELRQSVQMIQPNYQSTYASINSENRNRDT